MLNKVNCSVSGGPTGNYRTWKMQDLENDGPSHRSGKCKTSLCITNLLPTYSCMWVLFHLTAVIPNFAL